MSWHLKRFAFLALASAIGILVMDFLHGSPIAGAWGAVFVYAMTIRDEDYGY